MLSRRLLLLSAAALLNSGGGGGGGPTVEPTVTCLGGLHVIRVGASVAPRLLDAYPGAAAAYSAARALSGTATNLFRVRRSSDNAEQNIGHINGVVDTAALLAFCGAGNGFVTTWYDQSGNGNNQVQATTTAQPAIVSSGVFLGGLSFDGTNHKLSGSIAGFKSLANISAFLVNRPAAAAVADTETAVWFSFGTSAATFLVLSSTTGVLTGEKVMFGINTTIPKRLGSSSYSRSALQHVLKSLFAGSSGTSLFSNGAAVSLSLTNNMTTSEASGPVISGYNSDDIVRINGTSTDGPGPAAMWREAVFYPSNKSADRAGIESNINTHYSIW